MQSVRPTHLNERAEIATVHDVRTSDEEIARQTRKRGASLFHCAMELAGVNVERSGRKVVSARDLLVAFQVMGQPSFRLDDRATKLRAQLEETRAERSVEECFLEPCTIGGVAEHIICDDSDLEIAVTNEPYTTIPKPAWDTEAAFMLGNADVQIKQVHSTVHRGGPLQRCAAAMAEILEGVVTVVSVPTTPTNNRDETAGGGGSKDDV